MSYQAGVLLIELLIAGSIGVFLIITSVTIYQNISRYHIFSEHRFTAVETAAAVERIMHNQLHLAIGPICPKAANFVNIVNQSETTYWLDIFHRPVQIYAGDSPEAASIRTSGETAGDRVTDSDILVALTNGAPVAINNHNTAAGYFDLLTTADFEHGGFVIACDSQTAGLFQITDISSAGKRLNYTGGGVSPDNCASVFDINNPCGNDNAYTFLPNTLLTPLHPVVLFIGISPGGKQYSLYRERLTLLDFSTRTGAAMRREEIISGVVALRAALVPAGPNPQGIDIGIVVSGYSNDGYYASDHQHYLFGAAIPAAPNNSWSLSHEFSLALAP